MGGDAFSKSSLDKFGKAIIKPITNPFKNPILPPIFEARKIKTRQQYKERLAAEKDRPGPRYSDPDFQSPVELKKDGGKKAGAEVKTKAAFRRKKNRSLLESKRSGRTKQTAGTLLN